jgi:UDP-GlcNAc3NAcA epimerase
MKIVTIVGARPQFIKAAAVSRALRAGAGVREVLIHTGQHYDRAMSDVFFRELGLPEPDHHLGIGSGPHGAQTGRMLAAIEDVLTGAGATRVLIYGDTNSTLAGALAAAKLGIPIAHVEAGLRSFNRRMPEEINRVVADHLSALLLAPTPDAVANLEREGIDPGRIHLVGDVMFDVARDFAGRAEAASGILDRLGLAPGGYVLATLHRAENTDDPARLANLVQGLAAAAVRRPVVWPVHPRTRAALAGLNGAGAVADGVRLIEPVGYLDMVMLERHAERIATDSGGVQKEAFFHGVPCVTLRDETEWVELVRAGWNRLVPPVSADAVADALTAPFAPPPPPAELYGDGHTAERIAALLLS